MRQAAVGAGRHDHRKAGVAGPAAAKLQYQKARQIILRLADFDLAPDGGERFLGNRRRLADQGYLMIVLHLTDIDQHVLDGNEFDGLLARLFADRLVQCMNLPERRVVYFESHAFCLGGEDGLGQGRIHLPLARDHLQPTGFDLSLLRVAKIGHQEKVIAGDDPDRIIPREVGKIGKISGRSQQQRVEVQLLHRFADSFLPDFKVGLGFADQCGHASPCNRWLGPTACGTVLDIRPGCQRIGQRYDPTVTTQQALELAISHHQAGRLDQAQVAYRQILSQFPRDAKVLHLLGLLESQADRLDQGAQLIQRAINVMPDVAAYHFDLANALSGKRQFDAAIDAYRRAVQLRPDFLDAWINLGAACHEARRFDHAIAAYSTAIRLRPDSALAQDNLGVSLQTRGQLDEAIAAYAEAARLNPNDPRLHNHLGYALEVQGQFDQAIAASAAAIRLKPDYAEAHATMALALKGKGLLDDAVNACSRAMVLAPDQAEPRNTMGNILKDMGRIQQAIDSYRRGVELAPNEPAVHSNLLYTLYFDTRCSQAELLAEHRAWAERHAHPLRPLIRPHEIDRDPNRRLRIGYVSPDFRAHSVGRFMLPLLAAHDHQLFEIFCYASVQKLDGFTPRIQRHADVWRDIRALSNDEAADLIRNDRIDILVDLTMHMANNRMLLFARKPAPVQATYLAYAGTTGLDTIDYRITDPHLDPPGSSDEFYTERSIRLAQSYWCYEPPIESLEMTPPPAAAKGFITFGCLNNFCKITAEAIQAWCRILTAVPNSRLVLHAAAGSHRDTVRQNLSDSGIDPNRLSFVEQLPLPQYMQQYQSIDIGLDPFPYVGGTTTCDALWMGVPVVTLRGQTAISRGGASIMTNIGLAELIAESPEQYVRIAAELAKDVSRLSSLRRGLREQMRRSVVMDAARFARDMEAVYRQMWRRLQHRCRRIERTRAFSVAGSGAQARHQPPSGRAVSASRGALQTDFARQPQPPRCPAFVGSDFGADGPGAPGHGTDSKGHRGDASCCPLPRQFGRNPTAHGQHRPGGCVVWQGDGTRSPTDGGS